MEVSKVEGMRPIVEVRNLTKRYFIGQYTRDTLQHELQSWWAAKRGLEDPNRPVGAQERGELVALDNVSFDVYPGEAFGIIGRNGAGKSTLLKILSEITTPTSGEAVLRGRVSSMLEVGTGFDPELTGRENIFLNGAILGMDRAEVSSKLDAIIAFSEIGEFIDTPVKRYSSGMYSKLAFSVAAYLDSEILIMDEVLAVGDVAFREKCVELMLQRAAEGRTILYVGHAMGYVRQLCDRCMVLEAGRCVFVGDTEDAVQLYLDGIDAERSKRTAVQAPQEDASAAACPPAGKTPAAPKPPRRPNISLDATRDVSGLERSRLLPEHRIHVRQISYPDRNSIVFKQGEPVDMLLCWDALEDYEGLCLRIEVYTQTDSRVAAYALRGIDSAKAGEARELSVRVCIDSFAPGLYVFKQCFYFEDAEKGTVNTERVIGLAFEKPAWDDDTWDSKHMGNLRLDGIEVLE